LWGVVLRWVPYVAIAGLLGSLIALLSMGCYQSVSFLGGFNGDALSVVFAASCPVSAVTILMSIRYMEQSGTALAEFITILLTATLGMFIGGK